MRSALVAALIVGAAHGAVLPPGTELEVRLKSRVASNASKPGDAVEAVLIRPVVVKGEIAVPAGAAVTGTVKAAAPIAKPDTRALLDLAFTKLLDFPIDARTASIDNAREAVDDKGQILGILGSETLVARMDAGIAKLTQRSSKFGGFLGTVKAAVLREPEPEIVYGPGVEMTLALAKPAEVKPTAVPPADLAPAGPEEEIFGLVNAQPVQTTTMDKTPSDLTNLMFIGTEQELSSAFEAAGWATAAQLSTASGLEVFRAVAEMRGYKEAPMSVLLLDGNKPDLVFQKQNNTFAMRHHLRIWKRPGDFHGRIVWVCAATHDIGIDFSAEKRTFIHKIDPEIDRERAKVVGDLVFGGHVRSLSLVARPSAPQHSENATGDKLETDGRMAVLELK